MNMNKKNILLGLLSIGLINLSFANQVQLVNKTPNKAITVSYQLVGESHHKVKKIGDLQNVRLNKQCHRLKIPVPMLKYQYVGLEVRAVNGMKLPAYVYKFHHANTCSVVTNGNHHKGRIQLFLNKDSLQCKVTGHVKG